LHELGAKAARIDREVNPRLASRPERSWSKHRFGRR
jgi:hypothetical protein